MATNLVARDATTWHSRPLLFVLAFYNDREDRSTYTHTKTPDKLSIL